MSPAFELVYVVDVSQSDYVYVVKLPSFVSRITFLLSGISDMYLLIFSKSILLHSSDVLLVQFVFLYIHPHAGVGNFRLQMDFCLLKKFRVGNSSGQYYFQSWNIFFSVLE